MTTSHRESLGISVYQLDCLAKIEQNFDKNEEGAMNGCSGISSQIQDNFDIYYNSKAEQTWQNAKNLMIGEDHFDFEFRRSYSQLIDCIADQFETVVLVEGFRKMEVVEKPKSAQTQWFKNNKVQIFGWDAHTPEERYRSIPSVLQTINAVLVYQQACIDNAPKSELERLAKIIFDNERAIDKQKYEKLVRETFEDRTKSLIEATESAAKRFPNAKIIVIAGEHHLTKQENPYAHFLNRLDPFLEKTASQILIKKKKPHEDCTIQ